jgi:hypothetical protein
MWLKIYGKGEGQLSTPVYHPDTRVQRSRHNIFINTRKGVVMPRKRIEHKVVDGEELKYCTACETWHPLTCYRKGTKWDGLYGKCNMCCKKDYLSKKDSLLQKQKTYYENNREHVILRTVEWGKQNKEKRKQYRNKWNEKPKNKVIKRLRTRMYHALVGNCKSAPTMELIGCSPDILREHLESQFQEGMSWDNYGEWHVDHIKPVSSFDMSDDGQQKECFNYTNLQPLWASENLSKGARYDG